MDNYTPVSSNRCLVRVFGPLDIHLHAPLACMSSNMVSMSSNDSSSVRHSPFSNCFREIAIDRDSAALARQPSISSHVASRSEMLIVANVARPFCVMTIGRCVRPLRSKQSLRVRRYSVKGMTSSSRRGRWIVDAEAMFLISVSRPYCTVFCTGPSRGDRGEILSHTLPNRCIGE